MMHVDVATVPSRSGFKVRIAFFDEERLLATFGRLAESEDEAARLSAEATGHLAWFGIETEVRKLARSAA